MFSIPSLLHCYLHGPQPTENWQTSLLANNLYNWFLSLTSPPQNNGYGDLSNLPLVWKQETKTVQQLRQSLKAIEDWLSYKRIARFWKGKWRSRSSWVNQVRSADEILFIRFTTMLGTVPVHGQMQRPCGTYPMMGAVGAWCLSTVFRCFAY